MDNVWINYSATLIFALALIHTFSAGYFQKKAHAFPEGSVGENVFHLLGEIEVVFGLWAAVFFLVRGGIEGLSSSVKYLESLNYTEPMFVFVVLSVCSTRPVLQIAEKIITLCSSVLPLPKPVAFYFSALFVGPLLGSFITEPAAMAVTALILLNRYYRQGISEKLKYATIGLLFVNISIGGTMTPFAAPPILMVAPVWGWDLSFMLVNFGWRGAISCAVSAAAVTWYFRRELTQVPWEGRSGARPIPAWVTVAHLAFLAMIVVASHHAVVFAGIFLFFLGLFKVTREYQHGIQIREGLLVAFFLGGLVVLGPPQRWWLEPLLTSVGGDALFFGATFLTAFTDNAALTYLGAQVPDLADAAKIALVSGAVVGGGLTVVANAPNPAGYGILGPGFKEAISPLKLLMGAAFPTAVAVVFFWLI